MDVYVNRQPAQQDAHAASRTEKVRNPSTAAHLGALQAYADQSAQSQKLMSMQAMINDSVVTPAARQAQSGKPVDGTDASVVQRRPWQPANAAGLVAEPAPIPDVRVGAAAFQSTEFQCDLPASANKTDALVAAAGFIGGLGIPGKDKFLTQKFLNEARISGSIAGTTQNTQRPADWAGTNLQWNTYRNNIDPFLVRVTTSYPAVEPVNQVILTYEFGKASYGYVVRIQQDGGDFTMNPTRGQGVALQPHEFASGHATHEGANDASALSNARTDVEGITTAERGERLDAVTKVAGEGPRWQCVRGLAAAGSLRNDSRIYAPAQDGSYYFVTFPTLWGSWDSVFKSAFNIDNASVRTALLNDASRWLAPGRQQAPADTAWGATDAGV